ncbi:MAG: hypothetical protein ACR2PX_18760 [Endozoicomonas sp.]|uniref:hypothetical protein n=1 Tax=Endozoicomonas sp. TaxID=1892382 RepID=UPI003D9ACA44
MLKKFKGLGVGRQAFKALVDQFQGKWQVRVLKENEQGLAFWEAVVGGLTRGNFIRRVALDEELPMCFFWFDGGDVGRPELEK